MLDADALWPGVTISYSDGRPGHVGALATVLRVDDAGFWCQFEDRAEPTRIRVLERGES